MIAATRLTMTAGAVASLRWGNASLVEILWTLTGLAGMYFTWSNLRDARSYVDALAHDGPRDAVEASQVKIIAFGHYRNELLRLSVFMIICAVGIIAMITPAPTGAPARLSVVSVSLTIGLFAIVLLMVLGSALDRRQRNLMLSLVHQESAQGVL